MDVPTALLCALWNSSSSTIVRISSSLEKSANPRVGICDGRTSASWKYRRDLATPAPLQYQRHCRVRWLRPWRAQHADRHLCEALSNTLA